MEQAGQLTQEFLMKEVAAALLQHRKLLETTQKVELECTTLERAATDQKHRDRSMQRKGSSSGSPRKPVSGPNKTTTPPKVPGASPKRQMEGLAGKLSLSPKDKEKRETMESFDARLQSIITNALMNDRTGDVKDTKLSEDIKQNLLGSLGLNSSYPDTKSPLSQNKLTMLEAQVLLQRKRGSGDHHPSDFPIKREKESPKGGSQISLPVKIPLKDVGRKPLSVPVSIPLSTVANQDRHGHKDSSHHSGRPASPMMRDAYSPISRPSSSSSTASADSVKGLAHGATRRSTSPRTPSLASSGSGFNIDSIVSEAHHSSNAARFVPPLPHKDSFSGQVSPGAHSKQPPPQLPGMPPFTVYSQYSSLLGNLGLPNGPGGDKEHFAHLPPAAKQAFLNPAYMVTSAIQQPQMFYGFDTSGGATINGLPKDAAILDKPKRGKRKRSTSSGSSRSSASSKRASHGAEKDGTNIHSERKPGQQQSEIASMMSTASQPLAIQAISDAESSKSSPVVNHGLQRPDGHSEYYFNITPALKLPIKHSQILQLTNASVVVDIIWIRKKYGIHDYHLNTASVVTEC